MCKDTAVKKAKQNVRYIDEYKKKGEGESGIVAYAFSLSAWEIDTGRSLSSRP